MKATEIFSYLKKLIKGLIVLNCVLIITIVIIVYSFLQYLSLYDFTSGVDQNVSDIDTIENSTIEQHS